MYLEDLGVVLTEAASKRDRWRPHGVMPGDGGLRRAQARVAHAPRNFELCPLGQVRVKSWDVVYR